jgi:uncharacterized protein YbbC (DUF1343 family)
MVRTGLEVLSAQGFAALEGLRVGAICNPTSVDGELRHLADLLAHAPGVRLAALFGPEHGVRGEAQDMIGVGEARDEKTGVRVFSLYGGSFESLSPTEESLAGLDALVFDVQDVGSRYYTFVYTMALCMKAAARHKLKFFVLDRPNPIGGTLVEGNLVQPGFESFVSLYPIPNRHGMTAGELARHFNTKGGIGCELCVVACEGWRREDWFEATGLVFVPPSPNMPTVDTACVYPGSCLVEGTNLSEGRGTTRPFEVVGAPFLSAHRFCEALATERYEFVDDKPAIDLLCGTDAVRKAVDAGATLDECLAGFAQDLSRFSPARAESLIY